MLRNYFKIAWRNLVVLFLKKFTVVFFIANLIAWPLAYFALKNWLQDYVYRIEIGWSPFILVAVALLLATGLVIGMQTIKAALQNPVESLRAE